MAVGPGLSSTYLLRLLRSTLSDVDASIEGRWSDNTLLDFIDRGNKSVVGRVLFPDSRITHQTQSGVQLYQMPLMLKTDAIYVAGIPATPADLATLEGRQLLIYGPNAPPGASPPGPGSDAPPGTLGPGAPAWVIQEPLTYALPDGTFATPKPDTQPWTQNQPPRYYWRGGWLGILPIPANATPVTITLDGVRHPPTICKVDQNLTTPDNFAPAINWWATYYALFSDRNPNTKAFMDEAAGNAEKETRLLVTWRGRDFEGNQRQDPKPQVLRLAYGGGSIFRMRRNSRG